MLLWGVIVWVLKIIAVMVLAVIILAVGCAVFLSGRISRDEEKTAEYRKLVRRLYLANARKNAEAAANDHSAPLDLVRP